MDFQYIVDEKGRKSSVIVPIKEWEKRDAAYRLVKGTEDKVTKKNKKKLLRKKPRLLRELEEAVQQVNLHKAGKVKLKTWDELKDEL